MLLAVGRMKHKKAGVCKEQIHCTRKNVKVDFNHRLHCMCRVTAGDCYSYIELSFSFYSKKNALPHAIGCDRDLQISKDTTERFEICRLSPAVFGTLFVMGFSFLFFHLEYFKNRKRKPVGRGALYSPLSGICTNYIPKCLINNTRKSDQEMIQLKLV